MNGEECFGLLNLKIKEEMDNHRRIVDAWSQKALESPLSLMDWELSAWSFARARLEVAETLYNYAQQLLEKLEPGADLLGKAAYGKPAWFATPLEKLERGEAVLVRDQAGYRVEDI